MAVNETGTHSSSEHPLDRRALMAAARQAAGGGGDGMAPRALIGGLIVAFGAWAVPAILDKPVANGWIVVAGQVLALFLVAIGVLLAILSELRARRIAARWIATGNPHQVALDYFAGRLDRINGELRRTER